MKSVFLRVNQFLRQLAGHRLSQFFQEARHYFKYGDRHFPRSFGIEVSAFCNRVCSYCPNHFLPRAPVDFMSMELFDIVLERLREINWVGPVSYQFLGEPLLDKRLPELVRRTKAKVKGALPRVYTNGDFLTEDLLKELIRAGVFNIVVVRHPPFSPEWDARVIPLIKDKRYKKYFTYNGVLATGDESTRKEVEDSLHYLQTHPFGGGNETPDIVYKTCPHIMGSYTILRNGDVVQCCLSWDRQPVMGNVATEGLLEIWNKPLFKEIRNDVIYKKVKTPKMQKCKACFGIKTPKLDKESALLHLHKSYFDKGTITKAVPLGNGESSRQPTLVSS
jgi:GTP 3',8-cyclase